MVAVHCAQTPSHTHEAQSRAIGHRWSASTPPPENTQTGGRVPEVWTGEGGPARAARAGRAGAEEQGASIKASYQHASGGHRESLPAGKRPRRRGTTTRCHPHGTHGLDRRGRRHQWGRACSPCKGKSIPAASLGSPSVRGGISGIEVIGNVYKLTRSEDVSGHDTAVSASAVLADGGDVATMRNQHGVVINLAGTSRGANILVGVQGMKITVEGAPTASTRP